MNGANRTRVMRSVGQWLAGRARVVEVVDRLGVVEIVQCHTRGHDTTGIDTNRPPFWRHCGDGPHPRPLGGGWAPLAKPSQFFPRPSIRLWPILVKACAARDATPRAACLWLARTADLLPEEAP